MILGIVASQLNTGGGLSLQKTSYVNFKRTGTDALAPWYNNTNAYSTTATTLVADIADSTNTATGWRLDLVDPFDGDYNGGAQTGDNSGVFPDDVIYRNYYVGNAKTAMVRLANLNAANKYSLRLAGSRATGSFNMVTEITIGGVIKTYDALANTANYVDFLYQTPDGSGNLDVYVSVQGDSGNGYVAGFYVQEWA